MTSPQYASFTLAWKVQSAWASNLREQIAGYLGRVPEEDSSGESRRLGHISKQGSGILLPSSSHGQMEKFVTPLWIAPYRDLRRFHQEENDLTVFYCTPTPVPADPRANRSSSIARNPNNIDCRVATLSRSLDQRVYSDL